MHGKGGRRGREEEPVRRGYETSIAAVVVDVVVVLVMVVVLCVYVNE